LLKQERIENESDRSKKTKTQLDEAAFGSRINSGHSFWSKNVVSERLALRASTKLSSSLNGWQTG
jgi:hypothetical protein